MISCGKWTPLKRIGIVSPPLMAPRPQREIIPQITSDENLRQNQKNTVYGFEKEVRRGRHNQIDDVLYTLRPSLNFVSEMKKANKRASDIHTTSPVRLPGRKNM
jgi:hypothetical protein